MEIREKAKVPIRSEADIVTVRKTVRDAATELGFGVTDVARVVTAASELTRNVYLYAGSGVLRLEVLESEGSLGIQMTFEDRGPGIPDIDQAMEPGFSTSKGLGLGLPGAKRLMDEFEIRSAPGKGTTVTVRRWKRRTGKRS